MIALSVISKERLSDEYRVPLLEVFNPEHIQIVGGEGNNAIISYKAKRPSKTFMVGESVEQVNFLINYPEQVYGSVQELSAAGTTQGAAGQITNFIVVVTSASGSANAVKLPKANEDKVDYTYIVCNRTSETIQIFPASGDSINELDVDQPVTLLPGGITSFYIRTPLDDQEEA
jgi:hypothetical protein